MSLSRIALAFSVLASLQAQAQSSPSPSPKTVPRGGPITLDGQVGEGEWRNALHTEHPSGSVVRLLRDADHLYIGITSARPGFASLCVSLNDGVHVLHASAALGSVVYRPRGDAWNSADTAFTYSLRTTSLAEPARAERSAYLSTNGWVATTVRMSPDGRSQEMQLALKHFPLPLSIALARWLTDANASEWWPGTVTDHDGCFSQQLVRGTVPQGLVFKPAFWLRLSNE